MKELGKNFALYLEEERLSRTYPYRTILNAGINLALSSDAPVVKDFNPVTGIKAALFRKDIAGNVLGADEKISLKEALYAYTMGGAKANDSADFVGSIEVGKKADFIILDTKLPEQIEYDSDISVSSTYIDGALMYSGEK